MKRKLAKVVPTSTKIHKCVSLNESLAALPDNLPLALFVRTKPNPSGKDTTYLVFAPVNGEEPDLANTVSLELPCPPYCGKGNQGTIQVITVD
jgi:hypothetical protein